MKENKYIVYVKEVHEVPIEVFASDKNHARSRAFNLEGTWLHDEISFDDCLDPETWRVEEVMQPNEYDETTRIGYIKSRIDLCKKQIKELEETEPSSVMKANLLEICLNDLAEELSLVESKEWKENIGG
tara:strand:- start:3217 stop:3603 length:387 start_codon:yes stop_codon:yes gene_type:complete